MRFFRQKLFALGLVLVGVAIVAPTNSSHADAPKDHYTMTAGTVFDTKTLLTWQKHASGDKRSWSDAQTHCQNLDLEGTGWRVPSMKELQTIIDETQSAPAIDTSAFPVTPSEAFWTSSASGEGTSAWFIDFRYGYTNRDSVLSFAFVRCVR